MEVENEEQNETQSEDLTTKKIYRSVTIEEINALISEKIENAKNQFTVNEITLLESVLTGLKEKIEELATH